MPIPGFISWAHKDHALCAPLWPHIKVVERMFNIAFWRDETLRAGDRWNSEIQENLKKAKIIIQCVSTNAAASDYISEHETPAIKQKELNGALVIPILIKKTTARNFCDLHMIPHNPEQQLVALAEWKPRDRGYEAIEEQLAAALRKHGYKEITSLNSKKASKITTVHMPPRLTTPPPPDFDMEKVKAMILAGQSIPPDWVPWVKELDLGEEYEFIDATPLATLSNLQSLDLFATQITDVTPLAKLNNLKQLYLWGTNISDAKPLAGLSNLKTLYLMATHISDIKALARLSNLQDLDLGDTQVSDVMPLVGLNKLLSLDLSGTRITDASPLAGLNKLLSLDLSGTRITDVKPLATLKKLQFLYLGNTPITDVTSLTPLPNLSRIGVKARKRAKSFLSQLGRAWRVEKEEDGGWYELRRDVPGVEGDD